VDVLTSIDDWNMSKVTIVLFLNVGEKPIINPTDPYSNAKIHTEEEIEGIRDSCRLAAKVLRFAGSLVAVRNSVLSDISLSLSLSQGPFCLNKYLLTSYSLGYNINTAKCHHH
jgi:hypothetical protein